MSAAAPKMTPWFRGVPPVRDGVYKIKWSSFADDDNLYAHWGPKGWGRGSYNIVEAEKGAGLGANPNWYHIDGRAWRGLAEKPA